MRNYVVTSEPWGILSIEYANRTVLSGSHVNSMHVHIIKYIHARHGKALHCIKGKYNLIKKLMYIGEVVAA